MSAAQRLDDPAHLSTFLSMIGATPITTPTPTRVISQDIGIQSDENEKPLTQDNVSKDVDHLNTCPI